MDVLVHDRMTTNQRDGSRSSRSTRLQPASVGLVLIGSLWLAACASTQPASSRLTETPVPSPTPAVALTATLTPKPTRLPTRTARPTATPTPVTALDPRWSVSAWRIGIGNVMTSSWESEDRVVVTLGDRTFWVSADGEAVPAPTPEPVLLPGQLDVSAPDRQHTFAMSGGQVSLYAVGQTEPLGIAALTLDYGPSSVRWSPDSRRAVLMANDGLYWWDVSDPAPILIESELMVSPTWSPAGERLLHVTNAFTLKILSSPDHVVESAALDLGGLTYAFWQSPTIVAVATSGAWSRTTYYVDAETGRRLFLWQNDFFMSRSPAISPDGSWAVIDHSIRPWSEELGGWAPHIDHLYQIANLRTGATVELLGETGSQYLDWVGWSADSSRLWLISRPALAGGLPDPRFPFGLLALDPTTGSVEPFLDQAVFARLTPDGTRAWVIFPSRHAGSDTLSLDGGILGLSTRELVGRAPVADGLDYPIPDDHGTFPGAWTADGAWLVFADSQDRVSILNGQTGAITRIGVDLPLPEESFLPVGFDWAADQRHLLVRLDTEVWLVDVSALTTVAEVTP